MTKFSIEPYIKGILNGDRVMLARAITLIESNAEKHFEYAQSLLNEILSYTGKSLRIGITGVPGAGKSTFIEALGLLLAKKNKKVAVLTIDPSSTKSGGSIMGDKTRMENLSKNNRAFIRPSPSGGTLGGVARKTRESILLCEAAGFDVIIIETMGVGQGEISVRSMVDFFILIQIAGAGDELQGIKRGIVEFADLILINKADGENKPAALQAKRDLNLALHYMQPATENWQTPVLTCSSLSGEGIEDVWHVVMRFNDKFNDNGTIKLRRKKQDVEWMKSLVTQRISNLLLEQEDIKQNYLKMQQKILDQDINATSAAAKIIELIRNKNQI